MPLPNPGMSFDALDPLPAASLNDMVENIEALADGTGLDTGAVGATDLATSAITLGYAQITSDFTTATAGSYVDVTSLTTTFTVPAGGRRAKVTVWCRAISSTQAASNAVLMGIFEGATLLSESAFTTPVTGYAEQLVTMYSAVLSAGAHTFKARVYQAAAGTLTLAAHATYPAFILVELI